MQADLLIEMANCSMQLSVVAEFLYDLASETQSGRALPTYAAKLLRQRQQKWYSAEGERIREARKRARAAGKEEDAYLPAAYAGLDFPTDAEFKYTPRPLPNVHTLEYAQKWPNLACPCEDCMQERFDCIFQRERIQQHRAREAEKNATATNRTSKVTVPPAWEIGHSDRVLDLHRQLSAQEAETAKLRMISLHVGHCIAEAAGHHVHNAEYALSVLSDAAKYIPVSDTLLDTPVLGGVAVVDEVAVAALVAAAATPAHVQVANAQLKQAPVGDVQNAHQWAGFPGPVSDALLRKAMADDAASGLPDRVVAWFHALALAHQELYESDRSIPQLASTSLGVPHPTDRYATHNRTLIVFDAGLMPGTQDRLKQGQTDALEAPLSLLEQVLIACGHRRVPCSTEASMEMATTGSIAAAQSRSSSSASAPVVTGTRSGSTGPSLTSSAATAASGSSPPSATATASSSSAATAPLADLLRPFPRRPEESITLMNHVTSSLVTWAPVEGANGDNPALTTVCMGWARALNTESCMGGATGAAFDISGARTLDPRSECYESRTLMQVVELLKKTNDEYTAASQVASAAAAAAAASQASVAASATDTAPSSTGPRATATRGGKKSVQSSAPAPLPPLAALPPTKPPVPTHGMGRQLCTERVIAKMKKPVAVRVDIDVSSNLCAAEQQLASLGLLRPIEPYRSWAHVPLPELVQDASPSNAVTAGSLKRSLLRSALRFELHSRAVVEQHLQQAAASANSEVLDPLYVHHAHTAPLHAMGSPAVMVRTAQQAYAVLEAAGILPRLDRVTVDAAHEEHNARRNAAALGIPLDCIRQGTLLHEIMRVCCTSEALRALYQAWRSLTPHHDPEMIREAGAHAIGMRFGADTGDHAPPTSRFFSASNPLPRQAERDLLHNDAALARSALRARTLNRATSSDTSLTSSAPAIESIRTLRRDDRSAHLAASAAYMLKRRAVAPFPAGAPSTATASGAGSALSSAAAAAGAARNVAPRGSTSAATATVGAGAAAAPSSKPPQWKQFTSSSSRWSEAKTQSTLSLAMPRRLPPSQYASKTAASVAQAEYHPGFPFKLLPPADPTAHFQFGCMASGYFGVPRRRLMLAAPSGRGGAHVSTESSGSSSSSSAKSESTGRWEQCRVQSGTSAGSLSVQGSFLHHARKAYGDIDNGNVDVTRMGDLPSFELEVLNAAWPGHSTSMLALQQSMEYGVSAKDSAFRPPQYYARPQPLDMAAEAAAEAAAAGVQGVATLAAAHASVFAHTQAVAAAIRRGMPPPPEVHEAQQSAPAAAAVAAVALGAGSSRTALSSSAAAAAAVVLGAGSSRTAAGAVKPQPSSTSAAGAAPASLAPAAAAIPPTLAARAAPKSRSSTSAASAGTASKPASSASASGAAAATHPPSSTLAGAGTAAVKPPRSSAAAAAAAAAKVPAATTAAATTAAIWREWRAQNAIYYAAAAETLQKASESLQATSAAFSAMVRVAAAVPRDAAQRAIAAPTPSAAAVAGDTLTPTMFRRQSRLFSPAHGLVARAREKHIHAEVIAAAERYGGWLEHETEKLKHPTRVAPKITPLTDYTSACGDPLCPISIALKSDLAEALALEQLDGATAPLYTQSPAPARLLIHLDPLMLLKNLWWHRGLAKQSSVLQQWGSVDWDAESKVRAAAAAAIGNGGGETYYAPSPITSHTHSGYTSRVLVMPPSGGSGAGTFHVAPGCVMWAPIVPAHTSMDMSVRMLHLEQEEGNLASLTTGPQDVRGSTYQDGSNHYDHCFAPGLGGRVVDARIIHKKALELLCVRQQYELSSKRLVWAAEQADIMAEFAGKTRLIVLKSSKMRSYPGDAPVTTMWPEQRVYSHTAGNWVGGFNAHYQCCLSMPGCMENMSKLPWKYIRSVEGFRAFQKLYSHLFVPGRRSAGLVPTGAARYPTALDGAKLSTWTGGANAVPADADVHVLGTYAPGDKDDVVAMFKAELARDAALAKAKAAVEAAAAADVVPAVAGAPVFHRRGASSAVAASSSSLLSSGSSSIPAAAGVGSSSSHEQSAPRGRARSGGGSGAGLGRSKHSARGGGAAPRSRSRSTAASRSRSRGTRAAAAALKTRDMSAAECATAEDILKRKQQRRAAKIERRARRRRAAANSASAMGGAAAAAAAVTGSSGGSSASIVFTAGFGVSSSSNSATTSAAAAATAPTSDDMGAGFSSAEANAAAPVTAAAARATSTFARTANSATTAGAGTAHVYIESSTTSNSNTTSGTTTTATPLSTASIAHADDDDAMMEVVQGPAQKRVIDQLIHDGEGERLRARLVLSAEPLNAETYATVPRVHRPDVFSGASGRPPSIPPITQTTTTASVPISGASSSGSSSSSSSSSSTTAAAATGPPLPPPWSGEGMRAPLTNDEFYEFDKHLMGQTADTDPATRLVVLTAIVAMAGGVNSPNGRVLFPALGDLVTQMHAGSYAQVVDEHGPQLLKILSVKWDTLPQPEEWLMQPPLFKLAREDWKPRMMELWKGTGCIFTQAQIAKAAIDIGMDAAQAKRVPALDSSDHATALRRAVLTLEAKGVKQEVAEVQVRAAAAEIAAAPPSPAAAAGASSLSPPSSPSVTSTAANTATATATAAAVLSSSSSSSSSTSAPPPSAGAATPVPSGRSVDARLQALLFIVSKGAAVVAEDHPAAGSHMDMDDEVKAGSGSDSSSGDSASDSGSGDDDAGGGDMSMRRSRSRDFNMTSSLDRMDIDDEGGPSTSSAKPRDSAPQRAPSASLLQPARAPLATASHVNKNRYQGPSSASSSSTAAAATTASRSSALDHATTDLLSAGRPRRAAADAGNARRQAAMAADQASKEAIEAIEREGGGGGKKRADDDESSSSSSDGDDDRAKDKDFYIPSDDESEVSGREGEACNSCIAVCDARVASE